MDMQPLAPIVQAHFSMWDIFVQADFVVKSVILILVGASLWSWTIIFSKLIRMARLRVLANAFEEAFWSGGSLDTLYERFVKRTQDPMSAVFSAAMGEWRRATGRRKGKDGHKSALHDRIERIMQVTVSREMEALEKYLGFLASVASMAPFVGLFGTVWGIMNSLEAMGAAQSNSLTTVAPAIAEALFATALGLIVAIPTLVAYHKISGDLTRYGNRLDMFVQEFWAILSRRMDEGED
jgi:biopolymer transport protein TolQ